MGEIRLSIGQTNISGYMRINMREVQNDTVIVQFEVVPPPVPAVQNKVYTGLNNVVHYVDIREAPDAISQGLLLATYVYDVKTQTILAERRYYTTDGGGTYDPAQGDLAVTDPYLTGKNITGVFKEGLRYLKPTDEFTVAGDTVTLIAGPSVQPLQGGEVITIEITYTVSVPNGGGGEIFPSDIVQKTVDFTVDTSELGKMIEVNSGFTIVTGTIPDPLTLPDGAKLAFNTDNGAQRYLALPMSGGYSYVNQVQRSTLYMGRGEQLSIVKKGNYWRILSWCGNHLRVGEFIKSYRQYSYTVPETGAWLQISEYPRLFYWYVNELDPSLLGVGTFAGGTPAGDNMRMYCIDIPAGRFWVPNSMGFFERITDTSGVYDADRSAPFRKASTSQGDAVKLVSSLAGNPPKIIRSHAGSGGYVDGWPGNAPNADNFDDLLITGNLSTFETRPRNINRNSYIII